MNFTHTRRLLKKGKLITFAILTNCFIFNINPLEEKCSRDTDFNYCLESFAKTNSWRYLSFHGTAGVSNVHVSFTAFPVQTKPPASPQHLWTLL